MPGENLDRQARSGGGKAADQRADEHKQAVVGAAHRECHMVAAGVEAVPVVQGVLDEAQRLLNGLAERFGTRGRHQRQALAHQQRVAKELAEAGEGVAHARLAQPDPVRGPGDTAFGEQRVERYEEVEVYAGEVHPSF